jgi:hypothetical protein
MKPVELDEFVLMQVASTNKHKETLASTPERVPGASNPTFEWDR